MYYLFVSGVAEYEDYEDEDDYEDDDEQVSYKNFSIS